MALLTVGIFATSNKKEEKRVPIHPDHIANIDLEIRKNLFFEKDYGKQYGVSDEKIASLSGGIKQREELFDTCDIILLAKPTKKDFDRMKPGTINWGWPHCVQQSQITQSAIDRKLTLIAWEAMHSWSDKGDWQYHIFNKNNEIAGYAGVQHAMNLIGIDGNYGPNRKAIVISFGSVSQGAVKGLQTRGVSDITVYTPKQFGDVRNKISGANYSQFDENENGQLFSDNPGQPSTPFIEVLQEADIIVNGILQDTDHPLMFVKDDQKDQLKPGCLIIDISCDEGMGFSFAMPTNYDNPIFKVSSTYYYAVDHTPSYLFNAASWEISKSLLPYLRTVMEGSKSWMKNQVIRRAIEIKDGIIQNPKILNFQNREEKYPHLMK